MSFTGVFQIGRKETSRFSRQLFMANNRLVLFAITAMGMVAGNYLIRTLIAAPSMAAQLVASLCGGALVYGLCYGGIYYAVARSESAAYSSGHRWKYEETLQIGPTEICCTTEDGSDSVDFGAVVVHETKEDFYFYIGRETAWILPKNQLKNLEEDARMIRGILHENVEKAHLFLGKERKKA